MRREVLILCVVTIGAALECTSDLTLSWAIGKREKQINAECRQIKAEDAVCGKAGDLDEKWQEFVKSNDEYVKAVRECRRETTNSRLKRHHQRPREHMMESLSDLNDEVKHPVHPMKEKDEGSKRVKRHCPIDDPTHDCTAKHDRRRLRRQEKSLHEQNNGGDHTEHNHRRRRQEKSLHERNDSGAHAEHNHKRRRETRQKFSRRDTEAQCIAKGIDDLKKFEGSLTNHCKEENFCDFDLLPDENAAKFKELRKDRLKKYTNFYGAAAICHGKLD